MKMCRWTIKLVVQDIYFIATSAFLFQLHLNLTVFIIKKNQYIQIYRTHNYDNKKFYFYSRLYSQLTSVFFFLNLLLINQTSSLQSFKMRLASYWKRASTKIPSFKLKIFKLHLSNYPIWQNIFAYYANILTSCYNLWHNNLLGESRFLTLMSLAGNWISLKRFHQ